MAARRNTRARKIEFVNRTQGLIGANKLDRNNLEIAIVVNPGDHVFLTEEEIEMTAQAHKMPESSPFHPREIVSYDPQTLEETERFIAAPLERVKSESLPV